MDIVINEEHALAPVGTTPLPHQGHFYHQVLSSIAYPTDFPPVADLLRLYHGLTEGPWVIASPIHWQATHNDAMIVASAATLQLSDDESRRWFDALSAFVASENINLYYHDAHTWLLQCKDRPQIVAQPVHKLLHQSMMLELKRLDETLFWQRLITEIQMFFSAHLLNNSRPGLYPINGVWIWGGGRLPGLVDIPFYCDEPSFKLASLLTTQVIDVNTSRIFAKNGVLLYSSLDAQEHVFLQTKLQKNTVQWYWSNVAYLSKPKSWLSRLMGKI